jgi:hypothetical protein
MRVWFLDNPFSYFVFCFSDMDVKKRSRKLEVGDGNKENVCSTNGETFSVVVERGNHIDHDLTSICFVASLEIIVLLLT